MEIYWLIFHWSLWTYSLFSLISYFLIQNEEITWIKFNRTNVKMPHNENGLSESSCQTWKLICINAVTAGLEVVSSVVFTIVPPLLLKLGYSETQMSLLFGVGKNMVTILSYPKILKWNSLKWYLNLWKC